MTDATPEPDQSDAHAHLRKSLSRGLTPDARSRHIARAQVHAILQLADAIRPLTEALTQPLQITINTTPQPPTNDLGPT